MPYFFVCQLGSSWSWYWWFVLLLCVADTVCFWVVWLVPHWSTCARVAWATWGQATLAAHPCGCQCWVACSGRIGLSPCPACPWRQFGDRVILILIRVLPRVLRHHQLCFEWLGEFGMVVVECPGSLVGVLGGHILLFSLI